MSHRSAMVVLSPVSGITVHATNTEISGKEEVKKTSYIDCTLKSKHPTECVLIILTSQLNTNECHAVKAHGSAVTPDFCHCFKSVLFCVRGGQCVLEFSFTHFCV